MANYHIPTKEELKGYDYGQLEFNTVEEAEEKAMQLSADLKCGITISKRYKTRKFSINRFYSNDQKWGDEHVMSVHNYESPFCIESTSPNSGKHIEYFSVIERGKACYENMVKENYRKNIVKNF